MITIFDGYKKASDAHIAFQIALLESITFAKVLKPYGEKVKRGTVIAIKKISNIFGSKLNIKEPKAREVHEVLEEKLEELKYLSREELDEKIRNILCTRLKADSEDSDEFISASIIDEASRVFNINEYLTPAQKADRIYKRFNEIMLGNTENECNSKIEDFTQELLKAVLGMGSWHMLSGLSKIDEKMFAESVWFSVGSYGETFLPRDEDVPSWVPTVDYGEVQKQYEEFINLIEENEKAAEKVEKGINDLKTLEIKLMEIEDSLKYEKFRLLNSKDMKKHLDNKYLVLQKETMYLGNKVKNSEDEMHTSSYENEELLKELENGVRFAKEELENKVHQMESAEKKTKDNDKIIEEASNKIKEYQIEINDMNENFRQLDLENKRLEEKAETLKNNLNNEEENRCKNLQQLWKLYFPRFEIESEFLCNIIKFTIKERIEIEKILIELHSAGDVKCISLERDKDIEYFEIALNETELLGIEYKINEEDSEYIKLFKIYKKSDAID